MSLASPSFPSIKLKIKLSPSSHPWIPPQRRLVVIRCSNSDGPLRRPAAPSVSAPPPLTPPRKPAAPPPPSPVAEESQAPPAPAAPPNVAPAKVEMEMDLKRGVSLEYQRKVARELQEYFKQKKLEEADQGPAFGFTAKNEISNGRWAMFGFAVGLLTEYATGSDFVQQMKILLSNFGIVDLD